MLNQTAKISFKSATAALVAFGLTAASALGAPVKNIVLVHGAWVDGSGWKPVYEILVRDGYNVTVVQEPETSFDADVIAAKRILELQPDPCILVGHSYGGSIITEAGVDPHVVGLVDVAAHAPDVGEDEGTLGKTTPGVLAKTEGAVQMTADGFTYLNPDLEKWYYERAHSHMTEIAGASHSVYESHPTEVAAVIEQAAEKAQDQMHP